MLQAVGKRLSKLYSASELTAIGHDEKRLLACLDRTEREALGRGGIRFRIDRPAIVSVAAPAGQECFWLADQGFRATGETLRNALGQYRLFEKPFEPGDIALGVNGLDRTVRSPYAVFVRPADGGGLRVTPAAPADVLLVNAEGVSPFSDISTPFEALPERLCSAQLVRTRFDQRHAALLVRDRAWKTHVPSGPRPDQVVMALGEEPTTLVWTWRTSAEITASQVELKASGSATLRTASGTSWRVKTSDLLNDPVIRRHEATIGGLEPGSYAYRVGDGSDDHWSAWETIRVGHQTAPSFRFLWMGDPQTGLEQWGKLLESAYEHVPDVAFLLIAGDLVDRGNERSNWDHFFLRAKPVFDRLPMLPAVGNHEYLDRGPELFRAFFRTPANGPCGVDSGLAYFFTYRDTVFVVLDSTLAVSDATAARKQAEWLDGVLTSHAMRWKIVMFHHPVYASHPKRENRILAAEWVPVFDRHSVDLVLQGHDHAYLRTYPMRSGQRADRGTVYAVAVSGDKYYEQVPRGEVARGLTRTSTYQMIEVGSRKLSYQAFDRDRREVDRFVLVKEVDD